MLSRPRGGAAVAGVLCLILAAGLTVAAVVVGLTRDPAPHRPGADSDFVYAEGTQLMLHGEPFRYAGANAYTLMFEAESGVNMYMKQAVESEMTVLRAWAFYDYGTPDGKLTVEGNQRGIWFQHFDEELGRPVINEGPNGIERLDYMIYAAGEHGLRLVLPFVNNWTAFGGVDQYVRWAGGQYHDDFLRDETIKGWYKDWVEYLLNRVNPLTGIAYKDDPTILAWELGNELRCSESGPYPSSDDCSSDIFVEWAAEMSDFVRSIDGNHLIGFGGEGFLCSDPSSGSTLVNCMESGDPVEILKLPNIDLHGIHVYPNHWEPTPTPAGWQEWAEWWIAEHGRIADEAGKPYYIGEYGWVNQSERMLVYDAWLRTFYEAGGDGSHFWVMQPAASITGPTDGVGFTQKCPGAACDIVTAWSLHVRDGIDLGSFAPIAEHDQVSLEWGGTATVDPFANDKVFGDAAFDPATLDLDPETPGIQREVVTDKATFTVNDDGTVTVVHAADARTGVAKVQYVVADTAGRLSSVATLSASPGTKPEEPAAGDGEELSTD